MFNERIIYKLLRYSALAATTYLILRLLPGINFSSTQSLLATIIIIILSIVVELLCVNYLLVVRTDKAKVNADNILEKFDDSQKCDTCTNEPFDDVRADNTLEKISETPESIVDSMMAMAEESKKEASSKIKKQKKCRVVCDAPDDKEIVDEPKNECAKDAVDLDTISQPEDTEFSRLYDDKRYYWGSRYGPLSYDNKYGFGGMFYDEYPFYNRFNYPNVTIARNIGDHYTDRGPNDEYKHKRVLERRRYRRDRIEHRLHTTDGFNSRFQEIGSKSEKDRTTENRRCIDGDLENEIPYTDFNHLPIAAGYKSHDYEYGYSFIPPEKWYPQPPRPPICVTDKRCPVCPGLTTGAPADAKEFHAASRITPPDLINTEYIGDKLNAGR